MENGNICPYCKSISVEGKALPKFVSKKKKSNRSLAIVMVSIISLLTFLTIMVLIFTYGSFFREITMQNTRSRYSYSSSNEAVVSSIPESKKNYQKEKGIYTGGILKVGVDIPEGEYLAMSSANIS